MSGVWEGSLKYQTAVYRNMAQRRKVYRQCEADPVYRQSIWTSVPWTYCSGPTKRTIGNTSRNDAAMSDLSGQVEEVRAA